MYEQYICTECSEMKIEKYLSKAEEMVRKVSQRYNMIQLAHPCLRKQYRQSQVRH